MSFCRWPRRERQKGEAVLVKLRRPGDKETRIYKYIYKLCPAPPPREGYKVVKVCLFRQISLISLQESSCIKENYGNRHQRKV